jgi:integrase
MKKRIDIKQGLSDDWEPPFIYFGCPRQKDAQGVYKPDDEQFAYARSLAESGTRLKEWIVFYKYTNPTTGIKKTVAIRANNRIKNLDRRYLKTKNLKSGILMGLVSGQLNPFLDVKTDQKFFYKDALWKAHEVKIERKASSRRPYAEGSKVMFRSHLNSYLLGARANGTDKLLAEDVTRAMIVADLKKTQEIKGFQNLSYNLVSSHISDLFNIMAEEGIIKSSPAVKLPHKEPQEPTKYRMHTDEERNKIDEFLKEKDPDFHNFFMTHYYSGIRPGEILKIQIKNISNVFFLPKDTTKTKFDRLAMISKQLRGILDKMKLDECDPEWYLFSKGFKPGPKKMSWKYGSVRWKELVIDDLGIDQKMYAGKQTLSRLLNRDGVDIKKIQQILGHTKESTTKLYATEARILEQQGVIDELSDHIPDYVPKKD